MKATHAMQRRTLLKAIGSAGLASTLPGHGLAAELFPKNGKRVVVIGGGFGGAVAAKTLRQADPAIEVVLIERQKTYVACPTSNLVIGGSRTIDKNQFGYEKLAARGIKIVEGEVTDIDTKAKIVTLGAGTLAYDKLIVSPGIDFRFADIAGYDAATTPQVMPHAWKAGEQTLLLRDQLVKMKNGGTVLLSIPEAPFRCPPGPYERICQIAWYLKQHKPQSKIVVLDANSDILSKGALFREVWRKQYPGIVDYRPNHRVTRVSPAAMTLHTDVEDFKGDVVNLIPPQQAGTIAHKAKLVGDDKRWCPVDQVTYESLQAEHVHVIGDACIAGPIPKSGFVANVQGKICALNVVASLNGKKAWSPTIANVCYSYTADNEAVSVAAVFRVEGGKTTLIPGTFGTSKQPTTLEAEYAQSWFDNIIGEMSR